jgi:hypothetical protein
VGSDAAASAEAAASAPDRMLSSDVVMWIPFAVSHEAPETPGGGFLLTWQDHVSPEMRPAAAMRPSRRRPELNPHPEELVFASAKTSVSKDGHRLSARPRPSRRMRAPMRRHAPQGEGSIEVLRAAREADHRCRSANNPGDYRESAK